jgi:hypothetical protein
MSRALTPTTVRNEEYVMGNIVVREFTTLYGVIDTPTWTFDSGFDPKMASGMQYLGDVCTGMVCEDRG